MARQRAAGEVRLTIRAIAARLQEGGLAEHELASLAADPRKGVRRLVAGFRRVEHRRRLETERMEGLFVLERRLRSEGYAVVAGVDEAGVAPLAGPVVAAAVILPQPVSLPGLNDSKVLRPEEREALYGCLMGCGARIGIGVADTPEIDRLNILQATRVAWRRAVVQLDPHPDFVIIDGRFRVDLAVAQRALIDGDAQCASIAAASIVAKVTRDRMMRELDARYPEFGFAVHKGYPTPAHLAAIRRFGFSPVHRRSFVPLRVFQESLFDALA